MYERSILPAKSEKSASRSMSDLALSVMVWRSPSWVISAPMERRSSFSISASVRQRSRPMDANWIRFLSSIPSQKSDPPSGVVTTTMESC